jgi:hypothetical protein
MSWKFVEAFPSVNLKKIAKTVWENSPKFRNNKTGGGKKKTAGHDSWFLWLGQVKFGCCVVVQVGLFREIGIYPLDGHSV